MVTYPSSWSDCQFGAVIDTIEAGVSVRSYDSSTALPAVLKTSALGNGRFDCTQRKSIVAEDLSRARTEVRPDSLLISRMNTPALVGMVGYVSHAPESVFLPDRIWRVQGKRVNLQWLGYMLSSTALSSQIRELATGTSGSMKNIPKQRLMELTIPTPLLTEQRAIAEVLSGFDEHLANLDELIAKKKAIRDGSIEELISGNRRLEGFTEDWASYSLGEIATVRREVLEASIPDVDIELENLLPREGRLTGDISYRTAASLAFYSGDVLFGRLRPYLRKYWLADRSGVRSGEIWALVPGDVIVPLFLFHLVRSNQFISAANLTMGTKMPRADWQHMKDRVFRIPSIREQNAIATSLSALDNEIEALSDERAKVELLKLGAMDNLLTGRVRLPIEEEAA